MNLNEITFRSAILGASLALAATASLIAAAQPTASLPEEPTHGSIPVGEYDSESKLAKLAIVGPTQAIEAATGYTTGIFTEIRLDADNQILVWQVRSVKKDIATEVLVDAGTAAVLAREQEVLTQDRDVEDEDIDDQPTDEHGQENADDRADNEQGNEDNGQAAQVNGDNEDNEQENDASRT